MPPSTILNKPLDPTLRAALAYWPEKDHRIYSAAELKALLADCGFSAVTVYGALTGAPYDVNAQRLIALAVK